MSSVWSNKGFMEQLIDEQFQKRKKKRSSDNSCPIEGFLEDVETPPTDFSEDMTHKKKKKIKDVRAENSVDEKLKEEISGVGFREVYGTLDNRSQESKNGRKKKKKFSEAEMGLANELKEVRITKKTRKREDLEAGSSLEKELDEQNSCAVKKTAKIESSCRMENIEGGKEKKDTDVEFQDFNENGYEEKKKKIKNDVGIQTEESNKNSQTRKSKGLLDGEIDERPLKYHGDEKEQLSNNSMEENPSDYISFENDLLRKNNIKTKGSKFRGGKKAGAIDEAIGSQFDKGSQITEEKKKKKNKKLIQEESEKQVRNLMDEVQGSTDRAMSDDKGMSLDGAVRFEESLEENTSIDGLALKEEFSKQQKKKKNRIDGEENLDNLHIFDKSSIGKTEVERSPKRRKNRGEGGRVEVKHGENAISQDNMLPENVNKEKIIHNATVEEVGNPELFANGRSKEKRKTKQKERIKVSGDEDNNHWGHADANNSRKDVDKSSTDDRSLHKKKKKVTFSSQVQVCETDDKQNQIVWGKRFSPEEDQAIRDAISKYIKDHGLNENEGVQMILNCGKHAEVRNCWKEIAAALPWRPFKSVYIRGHIIYERSKEHGWTQDEIEGLRRLHNEHGNKWNKIAQVIGKCRYHVKDKWRGIKRGVMNRGHWSQDEYQRLSDLVHYNLQLKLSEKQQDRTHGWRRDNINWEGIADKMGTRDHVFCCKKWYSSLVSSLIEAGLWESRDDKVLLRRLLETNASNEEAVEWDKLVEGRSGEICHKRWKQMVRQVGEHRSMQLFEKIDLLVRRYAPELIE